MKVNDGTRRCRLKRQTDRINRLVNFIKNNSPVNLVPKNIQKKPIPETQDMTMNMNPPKINQAINNYLEKKGIIHQNLSSRECHLMRIPRNFITSQERTNTVSQKKNKINLLPQIKTFATEQNCKQKCETLQSQQKIQQLSLQSKHANSLLLTRHKFGERSKEKGQNNTSLKKQHRTQTLLRKTKKVHVFEEKYTGWETSMEKEQIRQDGIKIWMGLQ